MSCMPTSNKPVPPNGENASPQFYPCMVQDRELILHAVYQGVGRADQKANVAMARSGCVSQRFRKRKLLRTVLMLFFFFGSRAGVGMAMQAGDPVIAAAGDIACDPNDPNFKSGNGTP